MDQRLTVNLYITTYPDDLPALVNALTAAAIDAAGHGAEVSLRINPEVTDDEEELGAEQLVITHHEDDD